MGTYTISDDDHDGRWNSAAFLWFPSSTPIISPPLNIEAIFYWDGAALAGEDSIPITFTISIPVTAYGVPGAPLFVDLVVLKADAPASGFTGTVRTYQRELVLTTTVPSSGDTLDLTIPITAPLISAWRNRQNQERRMAFILYGTGAQPSIITFDDAGNNAGASLIVSEQSARTGLSGLQYLRGRRASGLLEDAKTGQWIARDHAVEDGYQRGLLVDPENWDPPDPYHYGRTRRSG